MRYDLEECRSGNWKIRVPDDEFDAVAMAIRDAVDIDIDTEHMLLFHVDGIKCTFVHSSGVLIVRTTDRDAARDILDDLLSGLSA